MNKAQHLTRGHKTLGVKWLFGRSASHQGLLYLDSEVAPKSPTFHSVPRSSVRQSNTLHAVIEMVAASCKVDPPQALYRRGLQTT